MLQKLNKFLNSSIVISGLMFLIGLILIIYPEMSFDTLTYVLSAMLIINGLYFIIEKESSILFSGFLMLGVIELLLGIVVILNPNIIKTLLPIVFGIIMVTKSTLDLRISMLLSKNGYDNWLLMLILSIISIICGLIIILNPAFGATVLTTYIGIVIVIYSVSAFVDTIMIKKRDYFGYPQGIILQNFVGSSAQILLNI